MPEQIQNFEGLTHLQSRFTTDNYFGIQFNN